MTKLAPCCKQLPLLEVIPSGVILSNAHARNAYGCAIQELVCKTLDLYPIPINGNYAICFDAEGKDGQQYEIKSVHRQGKVVLYDWRMKKEAGAGVPLLYAVLVHCVRGARSQADLWRQIRETPCRLIVLPAETVHSVGTAYPLNTIKRESKNPRNGYTRAGYKDGYRNLPVSALAALTERKETRAVELFGQSFRVDLYAPSTLEIESK